MACTCEVDAAVVASAGAPFVFTRLLMEPPRDREVRVRVVATGICRTDAAMRSSLTRLPKPAVLGHEGAGIVEAVGSAVTKVAPGDHVVMSFASCGRCAQCLQGRAAYCEQMGRLNFGGSRLDGTTAFSPSHPKVASHFFGQSSFATHALCHERSVVKVRRDVPLAHMGPLACGVQTGVGAVWNSLGMRAGQSIAVFGVGAVGLSAIMAARLSGASEIAAIDVNPAKLDLARELGATTAVDVRQPGAIESLQQRVAPGFDFTLDTSGHVDSIRSAMQILKPKGVCGLVSVAGGADVPFNVAHLVGGGRAVVGIHQGDSMPDVFIPQLIDAHLAGRLPFDRMLKFYEFHDINRAFDDLDNGTAIKPVLLMPGSAPDEVGVST